MFCSQFPGKKTEKISHSPIHQGLIYGTYIYQWWSDEWPVYTQKLCSLSLYENRYVMDLKSIDVINVSIDVINVLIN